MKHIFLIFSGLVSFASFGQNINTVAGIDSAGYNGDGMEATVSALNKPFSIAVNRSGTVFIADRGNSRVRLVNNAGVISTFAGTGTEGFSGDGSPATAAMISNITGVAADRGGNIYIADKGNERIRKVNPAGIITTIAGTGIPGSTGDGGPATSAELNNPNGVAVDTNGNIYIADQGNSLVRKVNPAGIISTIAGTGTNGYNGDGIAATSAQLYNPYAVAVDLSGNVYISDVDNNRIRKVSSAGMISTIAGNGIAGDSGEGGPATDAELSEPIGVATDSAGNVYIADAWNSRICVVNTGGVLNTIAGNTTAGFSGDGGPANLAELNEPYGVATDRSGIYIADYTNNRVRFVNYSSTEVNHVSITSSLNVFPNPTRGNFTITLTSENMIRACITVTDVLGEVVRTLPITTNKPCLLNINTPGLYLITVATASGTWAAPLVVAEK